MPPNPAPSSPRWSWAIRGAVLLVALAGLAFVLHRKGASPGAGTKGATATSARSAKAPRPVAVTARPRAGITGRVLDPDQKPVGAASVCVFLEAARGLVTSETRAPHCARTDKEGAYALTDIFPGTPITISAAAPHFVPTSYRTASGSAELRLADGEQRAGMDIVLRGGGVRIEGSVSDVTGGAVAGAIVVTQDGADRSVATSDAKGAFSLWVEPGPTGVGATATGYAPGWARGPAPGHFFKINLVPGSTLVGRTVITGDGTPVAGVVVEGVPMEGAATRASGRSDEEGRFRIEGLSPGRYRVEATSEGREGYSKSSVTLGLGETSSEVLIELDPAYVVRGRVVDKVTGEPCAGGRVLLDDHAQSEFAEATIEPDGWARMASVIPGNYRVEVTCNGHVARDDYAKVVVKDRDLAPLRWEVDKGASVRVEVVDGQRKAVTKASIWAFSTDPGGSSGQADHTEPDGSFLVSGIKPGHYNISVQANEGGRGDKSITVSADHEERLTIELPSAATIEGIVEDDAHRPVPNTRVMVSGPGHASTQTLDDGTFTVTGLPSGDYEVRASDRVRWRGGGSKEDAARVAKVTVTAPEHARVTLTVEGHGSVIEGKVIDAAGKPVTDGFIDCASSDSGGVPRFGMGSRGPIVTDTEGHFTVDGLMDGTYNLRAYRQGGTEGSAEAVKAGARDVVLKLAEGGSITGMLTANGAPVDRFNLTARNGKTGFMRTEFFFHTTGVFSLSDLPAGTYTVEADTPQGNASTEIVLADGEQKSGITLALTMRVSVDGRLVELESGAPVPGATLWIDGVSSAPPMNNDGRSNKTGPDGSFHLEGVLPGSWGLSTSAPDPAIMSVRLPIVVPEGSPTTDVGAIRVPRSRLAPGQPPGVIGVFADAAGVVQSYGPAAEAGIQSGDAVVSVDGFDVQGSNRYLIQALAMVPSGRTVTFGLADGRTVSVTAR
jgi:protocatechuate 3,4-dioxygenase beta subunit